MRILTFEEMKIVSGGGRLDSPDYGGARNTDFGASRGPQSRGGRNNDGRDAAMDSYLGRDVYGANAVGLNPNVARGAIGGAIGGVLGGLKGAIAGAIGGAYGSSGGGLTSPSPSNRGGGNYSAGRERGGGDSGGRGGGR